MSVAKKCDICGMLYESYGYVNNRDKCKPNSIILASSNTNDNYYQLSYKDCCPDCMNAILQTIDELSPIKEKSENETK